MYNLNKVMVEGNLTRDPEMKALPSGDNVTNFSVATNRVYNDRDGKRQEEVEYHNIVVFGKQADNVAKYLTKGSGAYIEGRLQTRSWDKDGVKMYRTEVVADRVQFGSKGEVFNKESEPKTPTVDTATPPDNTIDESSIPF